MGTPLGPKFNPYAYMDPLGYKGNCPLEGASVGLHTCSV